MAGKWCKRLSQFRTNCMNIARGVWYANIISFFEHKWTIAWMVWYSCYMKQCGLSHDLAKPITPPTCEIFHSVWYLMCINLVMWYFLDVCCRWWMSCVHDVLGGINGCHMLSISEHLAATFAASASSEMNISRKLTSPHCHTLPCISTWPFGGPGCLCIVFRSTPKGPIWLMRSCEEL